MGAIASAVGNVFAANIAAKGQKKAAALQAKQFGETKDLLSPYTNAGSKAMDQYGNAIGLNGAGPQSEFYKNFQTDPGFQSAQDYAQRGIENSNAIRGRSTSGGNLIAGLGDYLQKNMLGAYQNRISQIGGVVDTGRGAAQSLGSFGQNYANQAGQNLANAGYYQGAGLANGLNALNVGQSNAQQAGAYNSGSSGGGLSSAGNFLGSFFG